MFFPHFVVHCKTGEEFFPRFAVYCKMGEEHGKEVGAEKEVEKGVGDVAGGIE